jgi:hypothetical protein
MTTPPNQSRAAEAPSTTFRSRLEGPVLPFLTLLSFAVSAVAFVGYIEWQKHTAEKLLAGPANGAEQVYHSQGYGVLPLLRLAVEVEETRAPGRYLAALHKWTEALNPSTRAGDAPWVATLKAEEQKQVLAWVAEHKVSPTDIDQLKPKLQKISPQLSEKETLILEQLTSFSGMQALGDIHEKTVQHLFAKLYEMGATDTGLSEVGLENWKKKS